jgi:hypothetical protein
MSLTVLEHHSGIRPKEYHTCYLPDESNKIVLFYSCNDLNQLILFVNSLLPHRVEHVYCISDEILANQELVSIIHPLINVLPANTDILLFINNILNENRSHFFWMSMNQDTIIHPNLWSILEIAKKGQNYLFRDNHANPVMLYSSDISNANSILNEINMVAAYHNYLEERDTIHELNSLDLQHLTSMELSEMTIDVSKSFTPLCHLGLKYITDKTPYNLFCHRHPYTPIYDLFLRKYKKKPNLKMGEIGVLNGASLRMWREYFPTATIHAYDIDKSVFDKTSDIINIKCHIMDSSNIHQLKTSLHQSVEDGKKFDILIEDASHCLNHQLTFLRYCLDYVESGGVVIIEDIFRAIPVNRFQEVYIKLYDKIEHAILVKPEHVYRASPNWENDRMLIIWKA